MASAVAICSCPRLGFMDFMGHSLVAFSKNDVSVSHVYGAYWSQALSEGMKDVIEQHDYIFTTDYDSIFDAETVAYLLHLIEEYPDVDAICSLQQGRLVQFLFNVEGGYLTRDDLQNELVPITHGNFGLTVIRSSALVKTKKPWFFKKPSSDGDWAKNSDKVDEDIYFWHNFIESGNTAMLAPRSVIGHLELMVKWPSKNLTPAFQTIDGYRKDGKPAAAWE